jgi:hypothetical protein
LINGITRGANGIVVAADSGSARIHVWNPDGTFVRSVAMADNRGGFNYAGERASGSIVWAGHRPKPPTGNTAPTVLCPQNSSFDCAPATGLPLDFEVLVSDPDADQTLTVTLLLDGVSAAEASVATPAQDRIVPLRVNVVPGEYRLTVEVFDGEEIVSCSSLIVVNADTASPVITSYPADITVTASSSAGANVNYAPATASDGCSDVAIGYSHASGTLFPVGTTPVTITAIDAAGNQATASFDVTVTAPSAPDALAQLDALILTVNALPVKKAVKIALLTELKFARAAVKRNQPEAAVKALRIFEGTVEALRKNGRLTANQARQLITASEEIRAALNGP